MMEITLRFDENRDDAGEIMRTIQENLGKIADGVAGCMTEKMSGVFESHSLAEFPNMEQGAKTGKEKAPAAATAEAEKTKPPYIEESCKTKHFESIVACIHGHLVYLNITTQKLPSDTTAVFEDFPTVEAFLERTAKRFKNVDFFYGENQ